jgi:PAS domain S-box-containing protein
MWCNATHEIEHLNPAAQALFLSTLAGPALSHDRSAEELAARWLAGEIARFAGVDDLEYVFEKELISGRTSRWFRVNVKRVQTAPQRGTLIVLSEITLQVRAARLLRDTRQELEAKVEHRTDELLSANTSLRRYIDEYRQITGELKKLSRAVEQSAEHVIITDPSGVIEYVNPAFESLTGFSRQEVTGRTPRIVKSGRMPDEFYRQLWETIRSGQVFRGNIINRTKHGELYWEEKVITPLKDERGRITHFVSTGRDITDRMKSGEEAVS